MTWRGACAVLLLALAACAKREPATAEDLRTAITAYERGEAGVNEDRIAALFARLDAQVATLKAEEIEQPPDRRGELTARRTALAGERRELEMAYIRARVSRLGVAADQALKGLGDQLGKQLEDVGKAMRDSSRKEGAP